jgi:hypothetical protein
VPFYATALGLRSEVDIEAARARLTRDPPRLTIHRREDKYNNAETLAMLAWIAARSDPPRPIGPFDLYVWRREDR